MSKVQSGGQSPKARLARWALSVGARVAEARYAGRAPNPIDSLQWIAAQKLVVDKIKHALGLSQAELLGSGAAALPGHVVKWFRSLGLEILEDYGQSESAGVISMTEPGVESAGSVGRPFDGTEFKIAEDGEILTRGRHVFVEYYKDPAATRATLDAQGWLMTGDLGVIDDRGLLCIRGRKKEILKTSGGKMIAPGPLEARLKELCPIISQVCVVGDNRKYLSALVTLVESAPRGSDADKQVRAALDRLNSQLASYEQIKRFVVLERDFSVEQEEMTPTLKVKRGVIEKRYGSQIDSMYG